MSSEAIALGSMCKIKQGRYLSPEEMSDAPTSTKSVPVIGGNGVLGYTSEPSHTLDVPLITCRGSKCGLIQWARAPVWVSNNAIACDSGSPLGNKFLRYLFSASSFEDVITGSAQPQITIGHLSKKVFEICPEEYWSAIVGVLGALDDRITLLRETNATLEAIAQALFKSWFVDFDPVRAKMAGRAPEGMDEATAALFPDALEATELGVVPKGWQQTRVDSFIELAYGKALKAETRRPGTVPVYGSGGITGWHDEALVHGPSIIVGRKGTVGSLYWESRPFYPIDTVFYVKSARPLSYCYQLLKTLGLSDMNTDAAVPGLNRENAYRLLVPNPPEAVINAFDEAARALRQMIDHYAQQSDVLAKVRDTLLPRLISGQLRLPEVQDDIRRVIA